MSRWTNGRLVLRASSEIDGLACLWEFVLEPLDYTFDGLVQKKETIWRIRLASYRPPNR